MNLSTGATNAHGVRPLWLVAFASSSAGINCVGSVHDRQSNAMALNGPTGGAGGRGTDCYAGTHEKAFVIGVVAVVVFTSREVEVVGNSGSEGAKESSSL